MKKKYLLIVILLLIILGGCLFIFLKKDNDKPFIKQENITYNIPDNINIETYFIQNNNYLVLEIDNNTKNNIKLAELKIKFSTKEQTNELSLLPSGNKSIVKVSIPTELTDNILKEKINISLIIKEQANDIDLLDISKLNTPKPNIEVIDNEMVIALVGKNTLEENINLLKGYVILYNNNKIVEANDFTIENIKVNSDFNVSVKIPGIAIQIGNENNLDYQILEYDKLEIYYTYAY